MPTLLTRHADLDALAPPPVPVPIRLHRGRGAVANVPGRFERDQREVADDGWAPVRTSALAAASLARAGGAEQAQAPDLPAAVPCELDDEPAPLPTQVTAERVRSIISRNDSPDIFFDYSINPYRGCEHGCVYCYARPNHSYLGLSPGLDFETRLYAKVNAAEVLRSELQARSYVPRIINIGSVTDPYQPCEKQWGITRAVIEVLNQAHHPFTLISKGGLILRDLTQLAEAAAEQRVAVYITLVTLDGTLARQLEPRAPSPARRLKVIEALARAGVPVGVSVAPIIPFLNEDFARVLGAAHNAGAQSAFYTVLRLPWEVKDVFVQWLRAHYPDRAERVLNRLRDLRGLPGEAPTHPGVAAPGSGGRLNDPNFFTRMKGEGL
ncbi:MAG TPA: PA0069 family radical SAM protein, partial [Burkholderiaceae bacterium]|nr:PA0069 family radical SAM protein [Burkholderiaceae bacterium]